MIHYIIPARRGSKGLPFKNRRLLQYTIESLSGGYMEALTVTTDDEAIIDFCLRNNINHIHRSASLSSDTASLRDVMTHAARHLQMPDTDIIVMLYLTYPERSYEDIKLAIKFFQENNAASLLCRKELKTSPYLCLEETGTYTGKQIKKHDFYRRQDYPACFEISHFVAIFRVKEIANLNKNLYNDSTLWFYRGHLI